MNKTQTSVNYPRPPRSALAPINSFMTAILRSRWHGLRSRRLLLITFTGRKSGKEFTTPVRYVQEGEILRITVMYPWWKNLREQATVRVLLRGKMRTGTAEVFPQTEDRAVVKIHLIG